MSGPSNYYPGVYRGTVFSNRDPLNQGRLRLKVPQLFADQHTEWAWPIKISGVEVPIPDVGQGVWVMFEGGDPAFPVWHGVFGKDQSTGYKLQLNRLDPALAPTIIQDLIELVPVGNNQTEFDVTQTLINIAKNRYHGSFLYTGTQTAVLANTAYAVPLDTTELSYGVSVVNGDTIRIANTGIYNLSFSLQLDATNSSEHLVDIWLKHQGVNVPYSNSRLTFKEHTIAAWNFFLDSDTPNQEWQLMWDCHSANTVSIATLPASGPHPASPAAIVTVNKVK